jgi:hypothetical protein
MREPFLQVTSGASPATVAEWVRRQRPSVPTQAQDVCACDERRFDYGKKRSRLEISSMVFQAQDIWIYTKKSTDMKGSSIYQGFGAFIGRIRSLRSLSRRDGAGAESAYCMAPADYLIFFVLGSRLYGDRNR